VVQTGVDHRPPDRMRARLARLRCPERCCCVSRSRSCAELLMQMKTMTNNNIFYFDIQYVIVK
jgi:hypothetical protein